MNELPPSKLVNARRRAEAVARRTDHPLLPALIALLVGWALFSGELNESQGDWSAFIVAGDVFIDADAVPDPIAVAEGYGYDGQFFYRLALDPWTPDHEERGGVLDSPAWRHQRILYPVLTWLVSLGTPRHVPEALILVNLFALAAIGFGGGVIARRLELHAIWGILPALYPGFFLTLVRDTAEIVAGACIVGALAAASGRGASRSSSMVVTLLLCLAILARETAVLVPIAIGAVWLWQLVRREERTISWHNGVVPPLVMGLWHYLLYLRWDALPSQQGSGNVGPPFQGVIAFAREVADRQDHWESVWLLELKFLAVLVAITLISLWWSRAHAFVKVAYLFYLMLAAVLTRLIWVEDWSYMRALTELHVLAAVIILGAPRWLRITGVIVWLAFSRWMFVEIDDMR